MADPHRVVRFLEPGQNFQNRIKINKNLIFGRSFDSELGQNFVWICTELLKYYWLGTLPELQVKFQISNIKLLPCQCIILYMCRWHLSSGFKVFMGIPLMGRRFPEWAESQLSCFLGQLVLELFPTWARVPTWSRTQILIIY